MRLRARRRHEMRLESDGSVALIVSGATHTTTGGGGSGGRFTDSGIYTCTVTNEMGQAVSTARVTVRPSIASKSNA